MHVPVCTCAYVIVCTCAYVIVCLCAHVPVIVCTCAYVIVCTCAYVIVCTCAYVIVCTCAYVIVCTCAYVIVCTCAYVIVCTCAYVMYLCDVPVCVYATGMHFLISQMHDIIPWQSSGYLTWLFALVICPGKLPFFICPDYICPLITAAYVQKFCGHSPWHSKVIGYDANAGGG